MAQSAAQQRVQRIAEKVPVPDGYTPEQIGAQAALFVSQYRNQHQVGPTWREVAEHVHPDCQQTCGPHAPGADRIVPRVHADRIVRALVQAGWLAATRNSRSLRLPKQHEQ